MKLRKYIKMLVCAALGIIVVPACESWLDVKPVDKALEEQVFSTEEGFKEVLNGIYIELNQPALYGGELMFNMIEILAQRYNLSNIGGYKNLLAYNYAEDEVKQKIDGIWKKAYSLIMNCNKLIENADKRTEVLSESNYKLIKGEALALRALLHFDLLRLFGPVYKTNPEGISICYNEKFAFSASNLLPASQVVEKVLNDLQAAGTLLEDDPIITQGTLASDAKVDDNSLRYRNLRMNYYAVQALQARVYLYAQQEQNALLTARKLVEVQEKWFPFVEYKAIKEPTNKNPDRVFSTELIFALQNRKRGDIYTNYFSHEKKDDIFAPADKYLSKLYDQNDWRYGPMWMLPPDGSTTFECFHKYEKTETAYGYSYLLPMLRVSEMFFIVAETTDDAAEAKACLNRVREHRGEPLFSDEDVIDPKEVVAQEYVKEFFGEGQLFFYYKRVNAPQIPVTAANGEPVEMDAAKYQLPVPDSEMDYRN